MSNIEKYSHKIFEDIKHITEDGIEFWYGRELQMVLEYKKWDNFKTVIEKSKISCNNSNINVQDHFADVRNMVQLGSGAQREIEDIMLSRYACYLIVQNADPRKEVVALGQTYFAVKTREREIEEDFSELLEDANFQNKGYQGLYGGLNKAQIHKKKRLDKNQQILDHMGSTELAANLFRATQTDEKLRREQIKGKEKANQTHYEVGAKVRQTIKELGGTMPEDLPTPEKSVKQIEKENKKKELD